MRKWSIVATEIFSIFSSIMQEKKKKIIHKFRKKLQGFLSDESGKITKEDILKITMMTMGIANILPTSDANAWISWTNTPGVAQIGHGNNNYVENCYWDDPWTWVCDPVSGWGHGNSPTYYVAGTATANHVNQALNGRFVTADVWVSDVWTVRHVNAADDYGLVSGYAVSANCVVPGVDTTAWTPTSPWPWTELISTIDQSCHANAWTVYQNLGAAPLDDSRNWHLNYSPPVSYLNPVSPSAIGHGNQTHGSHGSHGSHAAY